MAEHEVEELRQRHFGPDSELKEYLSKRLQIAKQMDEMDAAGREIPPEVYASEKSLRTKKVRILNGIVFQAMADLTFFFECIAEHPDLKDIFDNDIQDLLGLRRNTPESQRSGYMFARLIRSILITNKKLGFKQEDTRRSREEVKDYRLILTDLLQQSVQDKVQRPLSNVIKTPEARKNVLDDFSRARGWTIMLKHSIDENLVKEIPHRIFDFGSGELLK